MLDNLIIVAAVALLAAPLATTLYKAFMKCFKNDTDKDGREDIGNNTAEEIQYGIEIHDECYA